LTGGVQTHVQTQGKEEEKKKKRSGLITIFYYSLWGKPVFMGKGLLRLLMSSFQSRMEYTYTT